MDSETAQSPESGTFGEFRLSPAMLQALSAMDIHNPTPIQNEAIPVLLDGHDVIGQARTGSGKTLAFGIPAIELIDPKLNAVQVLVLTPTRELAVQVAGVFEELARKRGIKVGLLFGGRAAGPQRLMLKQGIHVLVGTPGRVLDMLNQGALWLDKVRYLVLDEADEMLDRGFAPDVERILSRTTSARQTALFSATVPDWVKKTADRHLNQPVGVAVDPRPEDVAPIPHTAYDVPDGDKLVALKELLDHQGEGSILVFGRTKHGVKKLARQLQTAGYPVAALQGNLSQNARDEVMDNFRKGRVRILLATNVAARGLDITHVEQVINMELPESPQLLTHRVGRTGRMGRRGRAITLLNREDAAKWRQLERGLGRSIARKPWPGAIAALKDGGDVLEGAALPAESGHKGATPAPVAVSGPRTSTRRPRRKGGKESTWNGNTTSMPPIAFQPAPAPALAPRIAAQERVTGSQEDRNLRRQSRNGIRPIAPVRPSRASSGQAENRPQRASQNGDGRRHTVQCSACGTTTTVPFKPNPNRAVYCRDCYSATLAGAGSKFEARGSRSS